MEKKTEIKCREKGCKRGCGRKDGMEKKDGAKRENPRGGGYAAPQRPRCLLLLRLHTDSLVHNLHRQLLRAGDDLLAETERDVVVDDGRIATALHHEHLDVLHRGDVHAVHAVVAAVAELAVSPEADARHRGHALVAATHRVVDTVRLPPSGLWS